MHGFVRVVIRWDAGRTSGLLVVCLQPRLPNPLWAAVVFQPGSVRQQPLQLRMTRRMTMAQMKTCWASMSKTLGMQELLWTSAAGAHPSAQARPCTLQPVVAACVLVHGVPTQPGELGLQQPPGCVQAPAPTWVAQRKLPRS